jgi:hypothetical protein
MRPDAGQRTFNRKPSRRTGWYLLEQAFKYLYVTRHLLPGSTFPSPSKDILRNELISTIWFTMLGSFSSAHRLDLKKCLIVSVLLRVESKATDLLGTLPQHHLTRPACCPGLGLFAVEPCTLDTSPSSSNSGPGI